MSHQQFPCQHLAGPGVVLESQTRGLVAWLLGVCISPTAVLPLTAELPHLQNCDTHPCSMPLQVLPIDRDRTCAEHSDHFKLSEAAASVYIRFAPGNHPPCFWCFAAVGRPLLPEVATGRVAHVTGVSRVPYDAITHTLQEIASPPSAALTRICSHNTLFRLGARAEYHAVAGTAVQLSCLTNAVAANRCNAHRALRHKLCDVKPTAGHCALPALKQPCVPSGILPQCPLATVWLQTRSPAACLPVRRPLHPG